jgi:hypothetical protein
MELTQFEKLRINAALGQKSDMKRNFDARMVALEGTKGLERDVARIKNCTLRLPCNHEDCHRCANPKHRAALMRATSPYDFAPPDSLGFDPTQWEPQPEPKERNFRRRGGQHLDTVFSYFSPADVFTLTVHLAVVRLASDIRAAPPVRTLPDVGLSQPWCNLDANLQCWRPR